MAESPSPERDPLLDSILAGTGDRTLRLFAARGLLPLAAEDRLRALFATRLDEDSEIQSEAAASIAAVDLDEWVRLLDVVRLDAGELDTLARSVTDTAVLERIVRNRGTSDETLLRIAESAQGNVQDALVINQTRLLKEPRLIDVLFLNPHLTLDSRRRLLEMREEFFEKDVRRLRAQEEAQAAAILAAEAAELESASEETQEALTEGEAAAGTLSAEAVPEADKATFQRLAFMNVAERIDTALKGTREERRILVTDVNKTVTDAVLRCPILSDSEVEAFAGMRSVDTEIFRKIASKREWVRKYGIVLALVRNPTVPPDVSVPLIKFLRVKDLKLAAEDRNVPEAIRVGARKFYTLKRG